MSRFGAVVRLLMLSACLVPFTSPRQASAALALAPPPAAPIPAPADGPVEHESIPEDDTEREEQAKNRQAARGAHPAPGGPSAPGAGPAFPTISPTLLPPPAAPPRVAADPFRNGLGSPYRC
ncbi:MAG: hypothetical protein C0501_20705 [Isosphaera sp.]|nr:hypothetical protein [Isosphaera sp.]